MTPGVRLSSDGARFQVWAPHAGHVDVFGEDHERIATLTPGQSGWHSGTVTSMVAGDRYAVRLDDGPDRPDPASLSQPDGVHGPSAVVDLTFAWSDAAWTGRDLRSQIVYELHVGTFTPTGTLDAAIERLDHLAELGVTTVELMPVAQCPGDRNWGYDGVGLFAVQHGYGGAGGLQRFVDACHSRGLGVWLDVVYNHLGPDGNYLAEFGPYFTDRYHTPWGSAVNLDGRGSDDVRNFFIENALMWITEFHIDGLRLDAIHALFDQTPDPFLRQLADRCHRRGNEMGRTVHLIAENALNDPAALQPAGAGGLGLDAAWNDDFHHALHVALTGETERYYSDFVNAVPDLTTAISSGYVADGRFSEYRGRRHGASTADLPRTTLVVFAQNHDQVGNRGQGDRLTTLAEPEAVRLAAALVLLSPWVPMLFMGEEWGETRPFLYFVDHRDPDLLEAVRKGRTSEFEGFITGDVPDPGATQTRDRSVLDWEAVTRPGHAEVLELHRALIAIRNQCPSLTESAPDSHVVERHGNVIVVLGLGNTAATLAVFNVGPDPAIVEPPAGRWRRALDGSERRFGGSGSATPDEIQDEAFTIDPWGFALYLLEETS